MGQSRGSNRWVGQISTTDIRLAPSLLPHLQPPPSRPAPRRGVHLRHSSPFILPDNLSTTCLPLQHLMIVYNTHTQVRLHRQLQYHHFSHQQATRLSSTEYNPYLLPQTTSSHRCPDLVYPPPDPIRHIRYHNAQKHRLACLQHTSRT